MNKWIDNHNVVIISSQLSNIGIILTIYLKKENHFQKHKDAKYQFTQTIYNYIKKLQKKMKERKKERHLF